MVNIIDFPDKSSTYDRSCGECGSSIFTWQTSEQGELVHILECAECGETYALSGLDSDD